MDSFKNSVYSNRIASSIYIFYTFENTLKVELHRNSICIKWARKYLGDFFIFSLSFLNYFNPQLNHTTKPSGDNFLHNSKNYH